MPNRNGKLYKHEIKNLIQEHKDAIVELKERHRFAPKDNRGKVFSDSDKHKQKIRYMARDVKCRDGYVRHHWSYNEEDATDIIYLTQEQHGAFHSNSRYNKDEKKYETRWPSVSLLDTKFKHLRHIVKIMKGRKADQERWAKFDVKRFIEEGA